MTGGSMALMHLTITPLGTSSASVGKYVADIQKALVESGFPHKLTDMGTIIEGSSRELLDLAGQLSAIPFTKGVQRVVTQISLDDRRDKKVGIGDKVASVAGLLAQKRGD
jgi:uncharacterized protein (TIGR00106 family)